MRDAVHRFRSGSMAASRGLVATQPRWLWLGVALWLILAAFVLAGAPRPAAVALATLALLLGLVFFRPLAAGRSALLPCCFGLACWTAFTALPLPCGIVRAVAPTVADVWAAALTPLGTPQPRFCALSVAPAATVQGAMNLASYGVLAAASWTLARRLGLWTVLASVFGVAVLVALVTLVHGVLGAEHLFGQSFLPARTAVGPASVLVNPNNLAGYMNLGTFCGLALVAGRRPPLPRALVAVGCVLCVATLISSASRGGVAALVFGTLAWTVLMLSRRFARSRSTRSEIGRQAPLVLVILGTGVLIALLGSNPDLRRELFADDDSKVRQLRHLATTLNRVDWTGIGRGAFDSLSARLTDERGNITHEYAENFVLSWLFEWGPIVGGAVVLGLCWLLLPGRLGLRAQHSAEVAWLGLLVLLLQNLGDLGLELPALAGAFVAVLAGLEGSRRRRGYVARPSTGGSWTPLLGSLVALLGALAMWTALSGPALAVERSRTRELVGRAVAEKGTPLDGAAAWRAIEAGLRRYPGEPYFVLVGGWLAIREGKDAMPWAAEALRRAPRSARAHLLVAEVLARRGAVEQALLHVRLAADADATLTPTLAAHFTQLSTDPRRLEAAAPAGRTGARFLLEILGALPVSMDLRARRYLLEAAVRRDPDDPRVRAAEGWALLEDLRRGGAPCALDASSATCPVRPDARQHIAFLATQLQGAPACDGLRLQAALLAHDGRGAEAVDVLASCSSCLAPRACAQDRVALALEHGDDAERRLALGALRAGTCDSPDRCADVEAWLAALFERRAEPELALVHAWRAAETDPSASRYLAAARAARNAGRAERVEVALSRARRHGGTDPDLEHWLLQRRTPGEALK